MPGVWEPRFSEFIKAMCGLRESTALELLPDVMPVMNVLDQDEQYAFQRGHRFIGGTGAQAAGGAGTYSTCGVNNPAGSNHIIVVRSIRVYVSGAMFHNAMMRAGAALATLDFAVPLDSRDSRYAGTAGTAAAQVGVLSHGLPASPGAAQNLISSIWAPAGVSTEVLTGPVVLIPGWQLQVSQAVANQILYFTAKWEERSLPNQDELFRK